MDEYRVFNECDWDDEYCMYLRKSRADFEAESRGEGETLARHERNLLELANRMRIHIRPDAIYREVVSGETIEQRPVIQQVLQEVEDGVWKGVFVMEVERLARGDTSDQGYVADTFKYSGTKIITPSKIYDPNNEFDEEYFEFGLFMSRREYKTINRRQQRGRRDSVREGKFPGNKAPYGYVRKKLLKEKGFTLEPHTDQAPIVKLIFDMYVNQNMGSSAIADRLNGLGVPTALNKTWEVHTITDIIKNPIYYGLVTWGRRAVKKTRTKGVFTKSRPMAPKDKWTVGKGLHEPLVSKEIWDKAQELMAGNYHPPAPAGLITSSLAGLVKCELCGKAMVRRPYTTGQAPSLICYNRTCKNISSAFELVEERIIEGLRQWIKEYKAQWENIEGEGSDQTSDQVIIEAKESIIKSVEKEISKLKTQAGNLDDLLEQGLYTREKYMERSQVLSHRIKEAEKSLAAAHEELKLEKDRRQAKVEIIPKVEHVLDVYPKTEDAALRNELLKSVLEVCTYKKTVRGHWSRPDSIRTFDLKLYPKLPRQQ